MPRPARPEFVLVYVETGTTPMPTYVRLSEIAALSPRGILLQHDWLLITQKSFDQIKSLIINEAPAN